MGNGHYSNIMDGACPDFEITAIADTDKAKLANYAEDVRQRQANGADIPDVAFFEDGMELISSGSVDAVLIATPHYDHPTYAIEAFRHGLHVMSEKPAGVYTNQVKLMNEEASKHPELVFGMMFCIRTNPAFIKLKEIIDSNEMGAIRRTNWIITNWYRSQRYYDSGTWRATWSGEGGGVLLNQCPHQLDLFQWICGMPKKVHAKLYTGKWHDVEIEDDVSAYFEYENGATGTFISSTGDAPGTNRLEITCENGKLVLERGVIMKYLLDAPLTEFTFDKTEKAPQPDVIRKDAIRVDGNASMHAGVMNAFAGKILRGTPLIADGSEGIKSLTLSNAMHLSSWIDKEIEIPFDEDLFESELMKRVSASKRKPECVAQKYFNWKI